MNENCRSRTRIVAVNDNRGTLFTFSHSRSQCPAVNEDQSTVSHLWHVWQEHSEAPGACGCHIAVPIGNTNECVFLNGDPWAANHPAHRRPTSSSKSGQRRRLLSTQSVGAKRCGEKFTSTQPLMDCVGTQRFRRAAECVVTCLRRSQCHLLLLPLTMQSLLPSSNVILPI